jgi:hypothetical protein
VTVDHWYVNGCADNGRTVIVAQSVTVGDDFWAFSWLVIVARTTLCAGMFWGRRGKLNFYRGVNFWVSDRYVSFFFLTAVKVSTAHPQLL